MKGASSLKWNLYCKVNPALSGNFNERCFQPKNGAFNVRRERSRLTLLNEGIMDTLDFFTVDLNYISHLQQYEQNIRGFTRVPNMHYPNKKPKLVCGIVLTNIANQIDYYVGLTSYNIQKSENILITTNEAVNPVKGSLRFNFMFPVPKQCLTRKNINDEKDEAYKQLLLKEYRFIQSKKSDIRNKAIEVYNKIVNKSCSNNLLENSCDFKILEQACIQYIQQASQSKA